MFKKKNNKNLVHFRFLLEQKMYLSYNIVYVFIFFCIEKKFLFYMYIIYFTVAIVSQKKLRITREKCVYDKVYIFLFTLNYCNLY